MSGQQTHLEAIGVVRSCFGEKFAIPRQPGLCPSAWGQLIFHRPYRSAEAVRGLDGFSHIWLIFGFHQTADQGWKPTVRPPRLGGNQRIGVFASRSTFRPNGLGLSLVKLDSVELGGENGPILHLSGLDLLDHTPIYDVKPYLPYAEALPDAVAGFAQEEIVLLPVEIDAPAMEIFQSLPPRLQAVIRESLALDPRPAVQTDDPGRLFGALLGGYEVKFCVADGLCRVCQITPAAGS